MGTFIRVTGSFLLSRVDNCIHTIRLTMTALKWRHPQDLFYIVVIRIKASIIIIIKKRKRCRPPSRNYSLQRKLFAAPSDKEEQCQKGREKRNLAVNIKKAKGWKLHKTKNFKLFVWIKTPTKEWFVCLHIYRENREEMESNCTITYNFKDKEMSRSCIIRIALSSKTTR